MPATLASFSRARGRNEYLPVSKRTSDIFTIKPRAVSRVCRMALNWLVAEPAVPPSLWPRDPVRPGRWPAARRSRVSDDRPRSGRQPSALVFFFQPVRFGLGGGCSGVVLAFQAIASLCAAAAWAALSRFARSASILSSLASSRRSPASGGPLQTGRQPAPLPRPG